MAIHLYIPTPPILPSQETIRAHTKVVQAASEAYQAYGNMYDNPINLLRPSKHRAYKKKLDGYLKARQEYYDIATERRD